MPDRCFVPHCHSGTPGFKSSCKVAFFGAPKDPSLFQIWNTNIPRGDLCLSSTSKVCSLHFEEDDVVKGQHFKGKDGKDMFFPWNNWRLKDGAVPRLFPGISFIIFCLICLTGLWPIIFFYHAGCPKHLNKPKPAKRKLPKERQPLPQKKKKRNVAELDEPLQHSDDLPEDWEGQPVDDCCHFPTPDPLPSFKPEECSVPPAWYWIDSKDDPEGVKVI